jgi:hypothetical protein
MKDKSRFGRSLIDTSRELAHSVGNFVKRCNEQAQARPSENSPVGEGSTLCD